MHHPAGHQSHSGVSYYGMPIRESLATAMHPNELLDGAITVQYDARASAIIPRLGIGRTIPLVFELYQYHTFAAGLISPA